MLFAKRIPYLMLISGLATSAAASPPIPARVGGWVALNDGSALTQTAAGGYLFRVTKEDGTPYTPAAEKSSLNTYDDYVVDIPIASTEQVGGATVGERARIHVYKNGVELGVQFPPSGELTVGESGSVSWLAIVVGLTPTPTAFYSLTPCRILDTRKPDGALGGPALQPSATRTFDVVASPCGIPTDAVAISANLTVTNVGAQGELVVYPSAEVFAVLKPNTSAISVRAGRTRANNAIVSFSRPSTTFYVFNDSAASLDLILDVNGYFR